MDEDEITATENAFMQGREMKPENRKGKKIIYENTVFGELTDDKCSED